MLDRLFVSPSESAPLVDTRRPRKGAIIGAGQVGLACVYSMLIQGTFDEMVLVDVDRNKVEGEVMDLVHGLSFVQPITVRTGTAAEFEGSSTLLDWKEGPRFPRVSHKCRRSYQSAWGRGYSIACGEALRERIARQVASSTKHEQPENRYAN